MQILKLIADRLGITRATSKVMRQGVVVDESDKKLKGRRRTIEYNNVIVMMTIRGFLGSMFVQFYKVFRKTFISKMTRELQDPNDSPEIVNWKQQFCRMFANFVVPVLITSIIYLVFTAINGYKGMNLNPLMFDMLILFIAGCLTYEIAFMKDKKIGKNNLLHRMFRSVFTVTNQSNRLIILLDNFFACIKVYFVAGLFDILMANYLLNFSTDMSNLISLNVSMKENVRFYSKFIPVRFQNILFTFLVIGLQFGYFNITYEAEKRCFVMLLIVVATEITLALMTYSSIEKLTMKEHDDVPQTKMVKPISIFTLFRYTSGDKSKLIPLVVQISCHFMIYNIVEACSNSAFSVLTMDVADEIVAYNRDPNAKNAISYLAIIFSSVRGTGSEKVTNLQYIFSIYSNYIVAFSMDMINRFSLEGDSIKLMNYATWFNIFSGFVNVALFASLDMRNTSHNTFICLTTLILSSILRAVKYLTMDNFIDDYINKIISNDKHEIKNTVSDMNFINNKLMKMFAYSVLVQPYVDTDRLCSQTIFIMMFSSSWMFANSYAKRVIDERNKYDANARKFEN